MEGADDLGPAEVAERRANQHRPGIVQKKTSGCRYSVQKSRVISPLTKNEPKIHDDRSDSLKPPRAPTARMIATGPEAAKMKPITALAR